MYEPQLEENNGNFKRPRTASGGRGEGDWPCPNCGNVNFAFRATCNMRKCSTPKPAEAGGPQGAPPPMMPQPRYDPSLMPAVYLSNPPMSSYTPPAPYGSILQPSMHTGYPPVMQTGYTPHTAYMTIMPQPPPTLYPPTMDPYGGPPGTVYSQMQQGGGAGQPQEPRKRRGGPDAPSEGDWLCPKCGNTNFAFRSVCNMRRCSEPKPPDGNAPPYQQPSMGMGGGRFNEGPPPPQRSHPIESSTPEGSWTCVACANVNYPFRTHCNRRNCGVERAPQAHSQTQTLAEAVAANGNGNGVPGQ